MQMIDMPPVGCGFARTRGLKLLRYLRHLLSLCVGCGFARTRGLKPLIPLTDWIDGTCRVRVRSHSRIETHEYAHVSSAYLVGCGFARTRGLKHAMRHTTILERHVGCGFARTRGLKLSVLDKGKNLPRSGAGSLALED